GIVIAVEQFKFKVSFIQDRIHPARVGDIYILVALIIAMIVDDDVFYRLAVFELFIHFDADVGYTIIEGSFAKIERRFLLLDIPQQAVSFQRRLWHKVVVGVKRKYGQYHHEEKDRLNSSCKRNARGLYRGEFKMFAK